MHGNPARKEGVYGILMEGGGNIPTREDGTPVVEGGSIVLAIANFKQLAH